MSVLPGPKDFTWEAGGEFLNQQKKRACKGEGMYKRLLGLITPTKNFLLLEEFLNLRKPLKYAGGFRNLYFCWSQRLEV